LNRIYGAYGTNPIQDRLRRNETQYTFDDTVPKSRKLRIKGEETIKRYPGNFGGEINQRPIESEIDYENGDTRLRQSDADTLLAAIFSQQRN